MRMRKIILLLFLFYYSNFIYSQVGINTTTPNSIAILHIDGGGDNSSDTPSITEQVNDIAFTKTGRIGIGTTSPNSSALIEVKSANLGVYLPRVALTNSTDVTTIPSPKIGLTILQTANIELNSGQIYFWNGSKWTKVSDSEDFDNIVDNSNGEVSGKIATNDPISTNGLTYLGDEVEFKICDCNDAGATVLSNFTVNTGETPSTGDLCYLMHLNTTHGGDVKANISISKLLGDSNGAISNQGFTNTLTFTDTDFSDYQIIYYHGSAYTNLGHIGYISMNYPDATVLEFFKISVYKNANADASGIKVFQFNKF